MDTWSIKCGYCLKYHKVWINAGAIGWYDMKLSLLIKNVFSWVENWGMKYRDRKVGRKWYERVFGWAEKMRDFGGVHEFSLIAHYLWWFQSLLILRRKCEEKRKLDGKLPINPHLFPLMCVLVFLWIRICCKLSCRNSYKMHMYQVTIWWKIQSWYESFHLHISLDKCEALTRVHFCWSCYNLVCSKSLAFFIWTSKKFSFKIFFM